MIQKITSRDDLVRLREQLQSQRDPDRPCLAICAGTGCQAYGVNRIIEAFEEELEKRGLADQVDVLSTGCPGFCERGPLAVVKPQGIFYERMQLKDVSEVIEETLINGRVIDRLLYADPTTGERVVHEADVPFYKLQQREILWINGLLDPTRIEDYIALGGYSALMKALFEMTPDEVLEAVKKSGLRGRGGAGFPTGRKWEGCRQAEGEVKYVICNADEGDPGAFMDRAVLEGNPHTVLEGMIIGAYAVSDCREGYLYVRNEYPMAVENATLAIEAARAYGLLGENIAGSGFSFDVEIRRGGYSYSIDTVKDVSKQHPHSTLFFIIGEDSFGELGTWKEIHELLKIVTFLTVTRPGQEGTGFDMLETAFTPEELEKLRKGRIPTPPIGISSTAIREKIRAGLCIKYLVPEPVEKYISENKLYL